MTSLLASTGISLLEQGFTIHLNWLGEFVKLIIEGVGIVGVGVIVFALILKAITTPFDIYQRVKMRKQTLIMRKMQPELEKLQKQYANDKQQYNLKMMELQKKNGYSIFGACLPMIISLVILIVAVTAFQSYAQYANLSMYESMARGYNETILTYAVDGGVPSEDGTTLDYMLPSDTLAEGTPVVDWNWEYDVPHEIAAEGGTVRYTVYRDGTTERMRVESASETVYLFYTYELRSIAPQRFYYIDIDKLYTNQKDEGIKAEIGAKLEEGVALDVACRDYFISRGAEASAEVFRSMRNPGFLWVRNVWYPDVSYNHPIQDYTAFTRSFGNTKIISSDGSWEGTRSITDIFNEEQYNNWLTAGLEKEKGQPNGYFVMIIISIGLMLLSQFIMMRSQKETDKYQTVDGQGARTQKIMMVIMPLMFAVFGFMWSAAFTIYNIISSAISILVTLLCNFFIGRVFNKKEEEEIKQRYTRSVPWKQDDGKKKQKTRKK